MVSEGVTVTVAVDDPASDDRFDPVADQSVAVTVTDPDTAGFTLSTASLAIGEGASDTFTAVLVAQPTTDVELTLTSDDPAAASATPSPVTFTSANWNTPQTITIAGVADDDLVDESVTITASVADANSDDVFDPWPTRP